MKRLVYLQHVPYETPGVILDWAEEKGMAKVGVHLYRGDALPSVNACDFVVVMGGPMGVYDDEEYPWLKDEKRFLSEIVEQKKPLVGICLGAQLVAHVLGAKVTSNPFREFGYFSVSLTQEATAHPLFSELPTTWMPFHWHGDTFGIAAGSIRIAENDACPNQGFLGPGPILGLQFHLEPDATRIASWAWKHASMQPAKDFEDDGRYIQAKEEILSAIDTHAAINQKLLVSLLNRLFVV